MKREIITSFILASLALMACSPAQESADKSEPESIPVSSSPTTPSPASVPPATPLPPLLPSLTDAHARVQEDALNESTANARKSRLGDIHYQLLIDMASADEYFTGQAIITFNLQDTGEVLTIDFSGGELLEVNLNGSEIDPHYEGYFLTLPELLLRKGSNKLTVRYQHAYSRDGTGLHKFTDPEDGLVYTYSYLWPYYANRLFPAFDQPNLKAIFDLEVIAPTDWEVISTGKGKPALPEDGFTYWQFETTPKMSTYIFSLHAGPYKIWEDTAGDIPLRLLARQSLAPYVAADEWLEVTKSGLEHYAQYFEIEYPFSKYDQLIVPDFNIGAMENIGAVTFAERYVQRQPSSRNQRQNRAATILHEMAHMWFGDLVTKNWWDGLWLNESFATLMSQIALTKATTHRDAWHGFFINNKNTAYHADSRVTTHPIQMPVASTADFYSVFDSITYQKGASVLNQLVHYVGEENHRRGIASYLKKHAWGNTFLDDFITAQSESSEIDLTQWADQWLHQAGFNTLETRLSCEKGKISKLSLIQTAPAEHPYLRSHAIQIALYGLSADSSQFKLKDVIQTRIWGETTDIDAATGKPCPVLINPNHEDWSFARVSFDEPSVRIIQKYIKEFNEPLSRSMMWQVLIDGANKGEILLDKFIPFASQHAALEKNIRIQEQLLSAILDLIQLWERFADQAGAPDLDSKIIPELSALALRETRQSKANSDEQKIWFQLFYSSARDQTALRTVQNLLSGEDAIEGMELAQDLRWQLVLALSKRDISAVEFINAEVNNDRSDFGKKMQIAASSALPDKTLKSTWFSELIDPENTMGLSKQRQIIFSLFPSNQPDLQLEFLQQILDELPVLSKTRDPYFLSSYTGGLLQPMCRAESINAMAKALSSPEDLNSTSLRFLKQAHQADQECLALYKANAHANP